MKRHCLGLTFSFALAVAAMSLSGCHGPIGPGCANLSCNDCSGCGMTTQYIASGPLDALRQARRRVVCGAGCGETYVGEWISTPPDAADPCCGDQFVGGATKCRPFCWHPGNLFRGLYGKRFCTGDESSAPCGCEQEFCGGECDNCGATPTAVGGTSVSGCGCGNAQAHAHVAPRHSQIVTSKPPVDMATAVRKQVVPGRTNVAQRRVGSASRRQQTSMR